MNMNACILGNKQEGLELHVLSQKCAAKDIYIISPGKRSRERAQEQEQARYMELLYMMDSSLSESLQVRVSRDPSKVSLWWEFVTNHPI